MLPLQLLRFARFVDVPCQRSWCRQHPDFAVVDLCPTQIAMDAMVGIQCQPARQSLDLNAWCAALQGGGDAIGIEAEGETAVTARAAAVRGGASHDLQYGTGKSTASHPWHG